LGAAPPKTRINWIYFEAGLWIKIWLGGLDSILTNPKKSSNTVRT
jgi:hypothetical protein